MMGATSSAYDGSYPIESNKSAARETVSAQVQQSMDMLTHVTCRNVIELSNEEFELMKQSFLSVLREAEMSTRLLFKLLEDKGLYEDWNAALLAAANTGMECESAGTDTPMDYVHVKHGLSGVLLAMQLFHLVSEKVDGAPMKQDVQDAAARAAMITEARDRVYAANNAKKGYGMISPSPTVDGRAHDGLERMDFVSSIVLFLPAWATVGGPVLTSKLRRLITAAGDKGVVSMMPESHRLSYLSTVMSKTSFDMSNVSLQLTRWTKG